MDRKRYNALWRRNNNYNCRSNILLLLGNCCKTCGFSDKRALAIDHIDGGGNQDRKVKGGNYYYAVLKELRDGSNKYQLLCFNCNQIKKIENKEDKNLIHLAE